MKKQEIINTLKEIKTKEKNSLLRFVASKALDYSNNPEDFFKDFISHGCASGMISGLIYYSDTHKFFDKYYEEIEDLRFIFEYTTGEEISIMGEDLKNALALFGFEQTVYNLARKLELDL